MAASSAPKPPPLPVSSSSTTPKPGTTVTLPTRSVAEEAALKAKQMHLQSLREKVHGKAATGKEEPKTETKTTTLATLAAKEESSDEEEEEEEEEEDEDNGDDDDDDDDDDDEPSPKEESNVKANPLAGLQSPRSTGWKAGSGPGFSTIQSPTSTSWKPTDVDAPITSFLGSPVENVTAEEIAAVERAETIKEEPEQEEESEKEMEKGDEKGKK